MLVKCFVLYILARTLPARLNNQVLFGFELGIYDYLPSSYEIMLCLISGNEEFLQLTIRYGWDDTVAMDLSPVPHCSQSSCSVREVQKINMIIF